MNDIITKDFLVQLIKQDSGNYVFKFEEAYHPISVKPDTYISQEYGPLFMDSPKYGDIRDFALNVFAHPGLKVTATIINGYVLYGSYNYGNMKLDIPVFEVRTYTTGSTLFCDSMTNKLFNGHEDIAVAMNDDIKIKERMYAVSYLYANAVCNIYESAILFLMMRLDKEGLGDPLVECKKIYNNYEEATERADSFGCSRYFYYMACKLLYLYRHSSEEDFVYELPCYPSLVFVTNIRMPIGDIRLKMEELNSVFPHFIKEMLLLHKRKTTDLCLERTIAE